MASIENQGKNSALEAIIGKAILNDDFRKELTANPSKIAQEYNLTVGEQEALETLKVSHLETFADTLKARLLKSASVTIFCATE